MDAVVKATCMRRTTHTNTLQTIYTVAYRVDWQDSVRDMCWWLDQGICHEHANSHGADIGGVNNTDIPLPSGRK